MRIIHWRSWLTNIWFLHAISLALFFLAWDWLAYRQVFGDSLARPLVVLAKMRELANLNFAGTTLAGHIWASTRRVLIGFGLASSLAIPVGLLMATNRYINALVKPVFDIFKPMPPIAWVALSILWFGIGELSKIFIIAIGTFVPCLLNAYNGVRLVEPELYDVIRTLGGTRQSEIFHVCFPASFPAIFAGLQISLSIGWTCVLAAELINSRNGLGFLIKRGMDNHQPALVLGGMILIAVMAWLSSLLISVLERSLCPWKSSHHNH